MKKILTITAMAFTTALMFAQENANELKYFRFGLQVTPSMNWYIPDNTNRQNSGGVLLKAGGGLVTEFRVNKKISFVTGLQFDFNGGKIKYLNDPYPGAEDNNGAAIYYYSKPDAAIASYSSVDNSGKFIKYKLNERTYNTTYLTIPLTLKMKTQEIGMMTYFGQFGLNNSFRLKAKADDNLVHISATDNITELESLTLTNLDIAQDMSFYYAALNVGAGAEMNLVGTTSLVFGLNFLYGLSPVVKGSSDFVRHQTLNQIALGQQDPFTQKITSRAVQLTIGILF